MADKTDNIKTRLSFDGEAQYKAACREINSTLKVLNSEMKLVTAEYKDNANSTEALRAKQTILQKTYDEQVKKIKETETALEKCRKATGDNSEASKKLETQLNYQKTALVSTESELKKTATELEKCEKAADDLGTEIKESGEEAEAAEGKFSKLGSIMSSIGGAVAKGVLALGTTAASAATGLAALTVAGGEYADEVCTIAANTGLATDSVQKYQYALNFIDGDMNTLIKTMEKQKQQMGNAVEGNKAAIAAYERLGIQVKNADGTFRDSEEVYWEVIDALRGVTDEVERDNLATELLGKSNKDLRTVIEAGSESFKAYGAEAEAMGAVMGGDNLNALGAFDDKVQQLKAGMGGLKNAAAMIALPFLDTLAADGVSILGDFSKGIQDANGDMGKMAEVIGNTLSSAVGLIASKLPEFVQIGVKLITTLVNGLSQNLPTITSAAIEIIATLVQGITQLLPQLLSAAIQIITQLATGLAEGLPTLLPEIVNLVTGIANTLVENIPVILDAAIQLLMAIVDALPTIIVELVKALPAILTTIINAIVTGIPMLIQGAIQLLMAIVDAIPVIIDALIEALPQIINAIIEGLLSAIPELIVGAIQLFMALLEAIPAIIIELGNAIPEIITAIVNGFIDGLPKIKDAAMQGVTKIVDTFKELPGKIPSAISGAITKVSEWGLKMQDKAKSAIASVCISIVNGFKDLPNKLLTVGTNLVQGIWNGISNAKDWILDKIKGFGDAVLGGIKSFFGIASPSKVMQDQVGVFLAQGVGVGFTSEMKKVSRDINESIPREFDIDAKANVSRSIGFDNDNYSKTKPVNGSSAAGGITVVQHIYANTTDYVRQQKEAAKRFGDIARQVVV